MVKITSFGYKHGMPRFTRPTKIFDCRGLKNPHNNRRLRDFTGKDACVRQFVMDDPAFKPLINAALDSASAGIDIAFGCVGGRHRSVAAAIVLKNALAGVSHEAEIEHRELP